MYLEILIEKLNTPNRNGHIYTTQCINDAIINNPLVQERIDCGTEFIIDGNRTEDATNVIDYITSGACPADNIIGRVLEYYIRDDGLYALADIQDNILVNHLWLAGTGYVDENGTMNDYEFGTLYKFDNKEE